MCGRGSWLVGWAGGLCVAVGAVGVSGWVERSQAADGVWGGRKGPSAGKAVGEQDAWLARRGQGG